MQYLHTFIFDLNKNVERNFIVTIDGKKQTKIPNIYAGENARGIRVTLISVKNEPSLNVIGYFKQNDKVYRVTPHKRNKNTFEILFPILQEGEYQGELVVIKGNQKLKSGVFDGYCYKSLESDISITQEFKDSVVDIVNNYDIYSNLYKKGVEEVSEKIKELKKLNIKDTVDKNYIYEQISPSDLWTVNHNLDKYPSVNVIDSGNNVVYGDVKYIDKNNLQIKFNGIFSGKAIMN